MLGFAFCKCLFFYNKWPINHFPKHEHMWWKLINLQKKNTKVAWLYFLAVELFKKNRKYVVKSVLISIFWVIFDRCILYTIYFHVESLVNLSCYINSSSLRQLCFRKPHYTIEYMCQMVCLTWIAIFFKVGEFYNE